MQREYEKLYFVGIGGVGMSAIAYVVNRLGYKVAGSDAKQSSLTEMLKKEGITINIGHAHGQIGDCDAIVVSTAIKENNPEVVEAKERNIKILHRSDILALLINNRRGIAIAGAHGKTTTTAMLSWTALQSGVDPTVLIGGEVGALGGNAHVGKSDYIIAEADESDGSFVKFFPYIGIITNIENDHMDFYHTMEGMIKAFEQFIGQLHHDGAAILCFDDELLRVLATKVKCRYISYAIDHDADYMAKNINYGATVTEYDLYYQGKFIQQIILPVPGRHNVLNSLAVIAAGNLIGVTYEESKATLQLFSGAKRRYELKGKVDDITIVDDYAHHPSEIKTTLAAAMQIKTGRLICLFQPHRYTRTSLLKEDFGKSFADCDELILTEVYSAGEDPLPGVDGRTIYDEVIKTGKKEVEYIKASDDILNHLLNNAKKGDTIMTVGAGDIYLVGEKFLEKLRERSL